MGTSDLNDIADIQHRLGKELARMRVLLVDRHASARNSMRIILSSLGITAVHNAGTSAEVLRQVKAYTFDIILSDYHLDDGRDGQQLLEELRHKNLISLSTVYMVVTAERAYQNVVSVAELAPDDYLIKPFTADQFHSRLIKTIYKKHFFEKVFGHLDNGAYAEALAACDSLIGKEDAYLYDILRFKGEILNVLGRHEEAKAVYQQVLDHAMVPWARMGLAIALRGMDELAEAEEMGASVIDDFPEYLAAYDFVASVREEMGKLAEAQQVLQKATVISPNNSVRQRMVGDVAVRNDDLDAAERAYGKVLERHQGSSLKVLDDYTNLTRVMLDKGHTEGAKKVTQDLRRDWRGNKQGELAALIMDSLCCEQEGEPAKAKQALEKALELRSSLGDSDQNEFSQKIAVDLAHACLASGDEKMAQEILSKVAAENHEDRSMIAQIQGVFSKTGHEEAGQSMLAQVGKEIVELNNRGVLAARSGDIETSVQMLIEAAERVPNMQFLVNATKAIFTLLDRKGWDEEMGDRGVRYLQMAQSKDPRNAKVISARELYHKVARKFGIEVVPIGGVRTAGEKSGG
ncbi:Response regulator receiver protein [Candidatus Propionivibrio aalborgensis]|uniref:Response regulator receiver protein n=1 Tax=Candidatus Propionivibrio aalborgensis TaxID=1860101 RepID=A0A1A8Y0M5_9RHOO|nr:response regulator [Candidatus Propionivibrio aalborgensis]SBT10542.1 Response regulator receiver protein [Candidatus Propionivibrio aalborgensis]